MSQDPRIEAAALEDATDVVWSRSMGEIGVCCQDRERDDYKDAEEIAKEAITAYLAAADNAATITTEWGVRYSDSGYVSRHMSEGSARETADTHNAHDKTNWGQSFDMQVVSRTVAEWKETPDDHPTA